jgi:hypothetical protein
LGKIDPYRAGMLSRSPRWRKAVIEGKAVAILDMKLENRRFSLELYPSRCILKGEIHELILTDEGTVSLGEKVNRVSYLCFLEILKGGVVVVGDEILVKGKKVGNIVGFDETHMPNHFNIIIRSPKRATGIDLGLRVGEKISIRGRR